tara:strand:+ start:625 stop:888 length:264 start_codon:yes stop_codon:yes gene_type:complete
MIDHLPPELGLLFLFIVFVATIFTIKETIDDYRSGKNLEKGYISPWAIHSYLRHRKGSISQRKAGYFGLGEDSDFVPEADEEKNDQS